MTSLKNNLNQTLDFSSNQQAFSFLDNYLHTPYDVFNSIKDLIVLYNHNFEVIWANQSAQELFSKEKQCLVKVKCNQICSAVNYCDQCSVKQANETKHICENQWISDDGKVWKNTALPLMNEEKTISGILEIRKLVSEGINQHAGTKKPCKDEELSELPHTAVHVRLNLHGKCQYVSPNFRNILEEQRTEVTGQSFELFVDDADVLLIRNALERLKFPPFLTHFECRMLTCEGIKWYSWSGQTKLNDHGDISSIFLTGQDISRQKAVEEELLQKNKAYEKLNEQLILQNENYEKITRELLKRNNQIEDLYHRLKESEEQFRNMFVKHSSIMFLFDPETYEIIDSNFAAQYYYGFTEDEFLAKTLMDINVLGKEEIQQRFKKAEERKHQCVSFKHKLASGHVRDVEVYSVPILHKDEEVSFSIVYDVTKRKKAEKKLTISKKKLKEANDSKDKFFSIIAHDLKNPFNALIGLTDFLEVNGNNISSNHMKELIHTMGEVSKQGYNLLENLLQWSRTQMSNLKVLIEPVNLGEIIHENILLLKNNAEAKGITITCDDCTNVRAMGDANMISTVIRNLLANAIKYSYRNGNIIFRCSQNDKDVFVSVVDQGKGIEPDDLEKLFKIDENYSTPGTEKEVGTGLGLVLCKEFIDRCKGKLMVNSQPGVGSEFTFSLPKTD